MPSALGPLSPPLMALKDYKCGGGEGPSTCADRKSRPQVSASPLGTSPALPSVLRGGKELARGHQCVTDSWDPELH